MWNDLLFVPSLPASEENDTIDAPSSYPLFSSSFSSSSTSSSSYPSSSSSSMVPELPELPDLCGQCTAPVATPLLAKTNPLLSKYAVGDSDYFVVSTCREVQVPTEQKYARMSVLNALQTIVPAFGVLLLDNVSFRIIIYDFYFKAQTLHMIIIDLEKLQVFDAFDYQTDVAHMLCKLRSGATTFSSSSFKNFYVKTSRAQDEFQNIETGICPSARKGNFGSALNSWLKPGQFLSILRHQAAPPATYQPLTLSMVEIIIKRSTSITEGCCSKELLLQCPCTQILPDNECSYPASKIFEYLYSSIPTTMFEITIADIRKSLHGLPLPTPVPERKIYKVVRDARGKQIQCMGDINCNNKKLVSFWIACCSASNPICCKNHTPMKKLSICPDHNTRSRVAMLIE